MDPSYNNPLGGQMSPTAYPPQGDIILTPTPGNKQLNWKRLLILIGGALVVLILFIVVITSINNNNKAKSEADANDRAEKLALLENFYSDYNDFLSYYREIGYTPSETLADEVNDASKLFIVKRVTLEMLSAKLNALEEDIDSVANTDFDALSSSINPEIKQILSDIEVNFGDIKLNVTILKSFYKAFILPVQNDLDARTATWPCTFNVTADDLAEITVTGFSIEEAIERYNQAYCEVNDELYYEIFDGNFGSQYVRYAKEALIDALLTTYDQSDNLEKLKQILVRLNSPLVESALTTTTSNDLGTGE